MKQLEIHQTRSFSKQMQAMSRAGKKERDLVRRAEAIISRLLTDPLDDRADCRRTYNGEMRLKDCRKYNLSCGFRLIGLKRENRLIFTCIGSHDDCQKWIENNRDYQSEVVESSPIELSRYVELPEQHQYLWATAAAEEDEYEKQLMARIDDHLLREVFSGLYR